MDSGQNDRIDKLKHSASHSKVDTNDHPEDRLSDTERMKKSVRSMEQEDARSKAAWAYAAEQEELKLKVQASNVERFLEACRKASYGSDPHFKTAEGMLRMRKVVNVDVYDRNGFRAMHWAAGKGHIRLMLLLLHYKSDVNEPTRTDWQWTPLHFAVFYVHLEAVSILVDNGAELRKCGPHGPHPSLTPKSINSANLDKWTIQQVAKMSKRKTTRRRKSSVGMKGVKSKSEDEDRRPPTPDPPYNDIAQILETVIDVDDFV